MTSSSPTAHSKVGASSMYRWKRCPGSINFCKNLPVHESGYAAEGTKAHHLASFILENGFKLPKFPHPDFKNLPDDMLDAVLVYVDTIKTDMEERPGGQIFVECQFDLSSVYPGAFGTADCVVYWEKEKFIRVYDYKHGAGIAVDVEDNDQLKYYALGALLHLGKPCKDVECVIVQPRCPHSGGGIRRWKFDAFDLLDFAADVHDFAKRTEDPNAPLNPGNHCQFCNGKGVCPALHERALVAAQSEFSPVLSYDPEKLSQALQWLPAVETWVKGVREFAYQEAEHGRTPPGFKLVDKRVTRKWVDEEKVKDHLLTNTGVGIDEMYSSKLKTPAQIEKLITRNERKVMEEAGLILAEPSGRTLVPESDKRPEAKSAPELEFNPVSKVSEFKPVNQITT